MAAPECERQTSREDPAADGGVESIHRTSVADEGLEILPRDVAGGGLTWAEATDTQQAKAQAVIAPVSVRFPGRLIFLPKVSSGDHRSNRLGNPPSSWAEVDPSNGLRPEWH